MKHNYLVEAVCRATVTETWRIRSDTPLTREDIEDLLAGGDQPEGVTLDCTEEEVSDEEDREIREIEEEP